MQSHDFFVFNFGANLLYKQWSAEVLITGLTMISGMKIQYGIAGFAAGVLLGMLVSLVEMKWMMRHQYNDALPFVTGISVLICIIAGVNMGLRIGRRRQ